MRKVEPKKQTGRARLVVTGTLFAVGLAAVGLRGPGKIETARAEPQVPAEVLTVAAESEKAGYEFSYIPQPFTFLLAIRPARRDVAPGQGGLLQF